jgi:Xaa-Pro aminopeptidase
MHKSTLLKRELPKLKVDGLLITDMLNVRYISGFTGSSGYAIISRSDSIFVTDFRYEGQSDREVRDFRVKIERSERTREIKDLCEKMGIKKLGFEDHNVSYGFYKKLLRKKIRLKPVTGVIERQRVKKTPEELTSIKKAVRRAERSFKRLQTFIRAGMREQEIAMKLEGFLGEEGCASLPFGIIVASGPMAALPHARPTNRTLKKGDLVVIDWGGECNGYYSDMTRTVLLKGRDMNRQREIYETVREAQRRAVNTVRPGIKASKIDGAARDYIEKQGFGEFFGHGTGHGVGLAIHEQPYVSWKSKDLIKENMVFTIEPGIYIPGLGGVRIEDMVIAKKKGVEILNKLPGKINIIER